MEAAVPGVPVRLLRAGARAASRCWRPTSTRRAASTGTRSIALPGGLGAAGDAGEEAPSARSCPTPVTLRRYARPRWWALEDRKTNFGAVKPSTTDLAQLLLMEFALVYANDWFLLPFRLPAGTLAHVDRHGGDEHVRRAVLDHRRRHRHRAELAPLGDVPAQCDGRRASATPACSSRRS